MQGFCGINLGKPCSVRLNDLLGIAGGNAKQLGENMTTAVEPIYFVKHIDGTFSIATPQPTVNSIFDLLDTQPIANCDIEVIPFDEWVAAWIGDPPMGGFEFEYGERQPLRFNPKDGRGQTAGL